jgi:hypothetical protein
MRTVPVNQSAGPFAEGFVPTRLISIYLLLFVEFEAEPKASRFVCPGPFAEVAAILAEPRFVRVRQTGDDLPARDARKGETLFENGISFSVFGAGVFRGKMG